MKFIILFYLVLFPFGLFAQVGEWVWVNGSSTVNSSGSYGTQGVPSPLNAPPALYEASEWTDINGNFWLFNNRDLWKYDPVSNEWTWMKGPGTNGPGNYGVQGIPSLSNLPPAREQGAATWVDNQGNLWLFGGQGSGVYNDLWRFDIATNEWTWMKGSNMTGQNGTYGTQGIANPANTPGYRYECSSAWTDNAGDLWLFGGIKGGSGDFNDLWKYQIATNNWTWMKGSNLQNQPAVYGTLGIEAPANTPCARAAYAHWKDAAGNLWLFGGEDVINIVSHNDLWRFNPVTNNWAWIKGSNAGSANGVYGIKCDTASVNTPGARFETRAVWTDQSGNFWIFGGGKGGSAQNLWNDLWKYCPSTNQWVWISGNNTPNPVGNWGTKGVSNPANKPNGRVGALGWSDQNGHLFFWGGSSSSFSNPCNDMWKFTIDNNCGSCSAPIAPPVANLNSSDTTLCENNCINFFDQSVNSPLGWQWFFPGAVPASSGQKDPVNICYTNPGNYDVTLVVCNLLGCDTITFANFIHVDAVPLVNLGSDTLICANDTLMLNAGAGFSSYLWSNGSTSQAISVSTPGTYITEVTSGNCLGSDTIIVTTQPCGFIPFVLLESSDTTFCEKKCLNFFDLSTNNPTSWQWYFPYASPDTSTMQHPANICYNAYGTFDVTLVACNAAGCDTLFLPGFITVFNAPPAPVITQSNDTLFCSTSYSYSWFEGSNPSTILSTDSFFVVTQDGNYFVIVIDSNGCGVSSNVLVVYTGISQIDADEWVSFYPNPATEILHFSFRDHVINSDLQISNVLGEIVLHASLINQQSSIDISSLARGLYFLKITSGKEQLVGKVAVRQ